MTHKDILNLRLHSLQLAGNLPGTPAEVVSRLGALQAQDYEGAKWSIAIRTQQNSQTDVEKAIEERSIVRTWPMRGTLHFIASDDVRWMLKLLTPRIVSGMAGRNRQLELDQSIFNKSQDLLLRAMEGTKQLVRSEVYSILEANGIVTSNQRGIHIINYLAQNQILCHGTHNQKQPTYVLLDDWIPKSKELSIEEGHAEIAFRYFKSHGPATLQDFVWWTGLKITDARLALNSINQKLASENIEGNTYWFAPELRDTTTTTSTFMLPGFDEFMLGYTNRTLMVDRLHLPKIVPGNNGMFMPTVVIDGKVEGLWKKEIKKDKVSVEITPFVELSSNKLKRIARASEKYASYLGKELILKE
jgi:hypothetical protein